MSTKGTGKPATARGRKGNRKKPVAPAKPTYLEALRHQWRKRSAITHLRRFALAFVALVLLVPACLLLIYKIEAIRPVSTLMIRDAIVGPGARREWVELDEMAPVIYQSVMMSEDGRFCSHWGVDWTELNKVIDDAIEGERTRGASTITMQLVKNLFLWPDRSLIRKGLEVPYALMAELILGKRRIMEIYLNVVELDRGVYGVGAASRHYFNRSATKLGSRHAALLAVTLPSPVSRNPGKPTRRLAALSGTIRKRARASGAYIKCIRDEG